MHTVSSLSLKVKEAILSDFQDKLRVKGTVTDLNEYKKKTFFALKDDYTKLSCYAKNLSEPIQSGDTIIATGTITTYEKRSKYELAVSNAEIQGESSYRKRFRRIKRRLHEDGVFKTAPTPKPTFPKTIGVLTSTEGSAIEDVKAVFDHTYPYTTLLISHSPVQGKNASNYLLKAFQRLQEEQPSIILLTRGGGSNEHLATFNDERLARNVAKSNIPVVTGIGHEDNTTILDLVADHSASTPTSAAHYIAPETDAIKTRFKRKARQAKHQIDKLLSEAKKENRNRQQKAYHYMSQLIESTRETIREKRVAAEKLNPSTTINNDYYPLYKGGERISIDDLSQGDVFAVKATDTMITAKVQ